MKNLPAESLCHDKSMISANQSVVQQFFSIVVNANSSLLIQDA